MRLRQAGVYLILGGLGNVGLALARVLASTVQAKLVLVGRSASSTASRKISALQALESAGAEVLTVSADITDHAQMQAAFEQAIERFGRIDGSNTRSGNQSSRSLHEITERECIEQFRAKVAGAYVLADVLRNREVDFCLLISSVSSVLGVLGMAAYPAAHLFLDNFAVKQNRTHSLPWSSINLDNWLTGEGAGLQVASDEAGSLIVREEGDEVFRRLFSIEPVSQIVVSTSALPARIEKWINRKFAEQRLPAQADESTSLRARPKLKTGYQAPRNKIERTLTEIWQRILGIEQIGVTDNYFDLGGDSVLAIHLIACARQQGVRLTPRQLLEHQTIEELARIVEPSAAPTTESEVVTGQVPLTPTQRWFFEQDLAEPHHWNLSSLVDVRRRVSSVVWETLMQQLLRHHDGLRLRYVCEEGEWRQHITGLADVSAFFHHVDLSAVEEQTNAHCLRLWWRNCNPVCVWMDHSCASPTSSQAQINRQDCCSSSTTC